jgi:hypothetical protein
VIPRSVKARIDHEAKAMLTSDQQSPNRSAAARMLLVRGIIALDEERGIR